jgi:hypothetical protein
VVVVVVARLWLPAVMAWMRQESKHPVRVHGVF